MRISSAAGFATSISLYSIGPPVFSMTAAICLFGTSPMVAGMCDCWLCEDLRVLFVFWRQKAGMSIWMKEEGLTVEETTRSFECFLAIYTSTLPHMDRSKGGASCSSARRSSILGADVEVGRRCRRRSGRQASTPSRVCGVTFSYCRGLSCLDSVGRRRPNANLSHRDASS